MSDVMVFEGCTAKPLFSLSHSASNADAVAHVFERAQEASRAGQWNRAAELYRTMGKLAPELVAAHLGLASAELANGDVSAGAAALKKACELEPQSCDLHLQLGVVLAHGGNIRGAEAAFCRVLDIDETNLDALLSVAQICRVQNCYVEAINVLEHANRHHPDHPDIVAALGLLGTEIGDWQGAVELLEKLMREAPDHSECKLLAERIAVWRTEAN